MAGSVLVDAGFLIALLSRRDRHHPWAAAQSPRLAPPWKTCEAALSEAFHLVGSRGWPSLAAPLRRGAAVVTSHLCAAATMRREASPAARTDKVEYIRRAHVATPATAPSLRTSFACNKV